MLDMKLILNDTQAVKDAIHKREMNLDDTVDAIVQLDAQRRELIGNVEKMKAERNACSKKIPQMKKAGEDTTELMASMKKLADTIKEYPRSYLWRKAGIFLYAEEPCGPVRELGPD